jgi:GNAT superfamily N-acetyltransferase
MGCPFESFRLAWGRALPPYAGQLAFPVESWDAIASFFQPEQASAEGVVRTLMRGLPITLAVTIKAQEIKRTDGQTVVPYLQIETQGTAAGPVFQIVIGFYRLDGEMILEAGLVRLDPAVQGQGWGSRIVRNLADICDVLNISAIQFEAGMSVGGYAWASLGGEPVDSELFLRMWRDKLVSLQNEQPGRFQDDIDLMDHALRNGHADRLVRILLKGFADPAASNSPAYQALLGAQWSGYWSPRLKPHRERLARALGLRPGKA